MTKTTTCLTQIWENRFVPMTQTKRASVIRSTCYLLTPRFFLAKIKGGTYQLTEVKGDNKIDDVVVHKI